MTEPLNPERNEEEPSEAKVQGNSRRQFLRISIFTMTVVTAALVYFVVFDLARLSSTFLKLFTAIIFIELVLYVLLIVDYATGGRVFSKIGFFSLGTELQTEVLGRSTQEYKSKPTFFKRFRKKKKAATLPPLYKIKSRNMIERFAYRHVASRLPNLSGEAYEQSGIPLVYESYVSTAFLLSSIITLPAFVMSFLIELKLWHILPLISLAGSLILSGIVFATSLFIWLLYPVQRRRTFKTRLENQLAYAFGVLGALTAAGVTMEKLFERIASTDSNPVLAELARRFLRNVKIFGLDTESSLNEVAEHSPSPAFSKMLQSMAVAFKTTGSIHDLVMFESARLLQEKKDLLKKSVSTLAIMAELYITLVVVGPLVFVMMLTIFLFLPTGGKTVLPDPSMLINLIVFIGVPVISVMFVLLLDSIVAKV